MLDKMRNQGACAMSNNTSRHGDGGNTILTDIFSVFPAKMDRRKQQPRSTCGYDDMWLLKLHDD